MAFTLNCTHCGCLVTAPNPAPGQTYAGKKGRCLSCGGIVELAPANVDNYDLQDVSEASGAPRAAQAPSPAAPPQSIPGPSPAEMPAMIKPEAPPASRVPIPTKAVAPPAHASPSPATPLPIPSPVRPRAPVIPDDLAATRQASIRAVEPQKSSGFKVFLIAFAILLLLCGGGVAVTAFILWPKIAGLGSESRANIAKANSQLILLAQRTYFTANAQYAQSVEELRQALGPNADKVLGPDGGYQFKILKAQGSNAPGGAKSYFDANGRMTQGFAILAYPQDLSAASSTIIITGMDGRMHRMDVAPVLADQVRKLEIYDPNPHWKNMQ